MKQKQVTNLLFVKSLEDFFSQCLTEKSIEYIKRKARVSFYSISIRNFEQYYLYVETSNVYISYIWHKSDIVLTGFHLNNDDIDEEGNFIFVTGVNEKERGRINLLINNGFKI
ncbi:hypothetical protein FW755_06290 [Lonepinella koalarum]|uniref:hypothetical protein n=1 Tax=Lonepinella koalarum TaxID=53417 RepID=UPI0011E4B9EF|nr:hypothetical protein [Lonepinella koalarum]TYG34718.1 hypothetical protein FW755_06290 [Lonepinella koalarum]